MAELKVKSKFFAMEDKVEVDSDDVASAVNEQITAGKIDIPAGTKLYKHTIKLYTSSHSYGHTFTLITKSETSLTTLAEVFNILSNKQYELYLKEPVMVTQTYTVPGKANTRFEDLFWGNTGLGGGNHIYGYRTFINISEGVASFSTDGGELTYFDSDIVTEL